MRYLFLLCVILMSCNTNLSSVQNPNDEGSGSGQDNPNPAPPELLSGAEVFSAASTGIANVGAALSSVPIIGSQSLMSNCDEVVIDLATDSLGAGEYLACLLQENSKNPETPRGAFHLIGEIMNLLEANVSFNYDSIFSQHTGITGTLDTSDGDQTVELDLREKAVSGSDWNYHIQLCILDLNGMSLNTSINDCINGSFTFEIFLVSNQSKIGFKTIERVISFGGGTSFLLDAISGELRFESWDEVNGRHSRVYVEGAVSTGFELESISSARVATASEGIEAMGDGADALYADFDGDNLCINAWDDDDFDHTNGVGNQVTNLTAQGMCSTFPVYDGNFYSSGSLEAFLVNEAKGALDFDSSSFGIDSYFIDL